MNKRIDFTKLGGYPLAQEDLDWLQTSYRAAFAALADMIGNMVIISGVEDLGGGNVGPGWISVDGELVPFEGGAVGTGAFLIDEVATPLIFHDGNNNVVLYERTAKFGVLGGYNYNDLVRLTALKNIWKKDDIRQCVKDAAYEAANFDVDGYGINEEVGWRILSKVYADAAGAVMVNKKTGDADFGTVADLVGVKEAVMTPAQLPAIAGKGLVLINGLNTFTSGDASGGEFDNKDSYAWPGADEPISKIQPSFVVLTLIKL